MCVYIEVQNLILCDWRCIMSGDISPMSPASPTPLVREKRHYPGDQKEKKQKQDDDAQSKKEPDNDAQQKPVNIDEKNGKVGHIDEYV